MNNIQKQLFFAIIITACFGTNAMAHERSNSGHVISVWPVHESWVEHRQVAKTQCHQVYKSNKTRVHDAVLGSLIGSIVGNQISDSPGFGSFGAVVGMAIADSRHQHTERCQTIWRPQRFTRRSLSHYEVSVAHRGQIIQLRSQHPYLIGEHIRFAH